MVQVPRCLSVLVCTSTYWLVNIRNSMNQYILLHDWYESVRIRVSNYVLVHTSIFRKFWFSLIQTGTCPLLDTRWYQAVHGSTRKPRTPWICRYKAVQGLVPSCTSLYLHIQGYGTFWYCHVPQYTNFTALYRLVPPCIQKRTRGYKAVWESTRRDNLAWTSLYLYIPASMNLDVYVQYTLVCTCTYEYVLVHTSTYLVQAGMYQYIRNHKGTY